MIFHAIKKLTPPIVIDFIRYFQKVEKNYIHWSGDYASWQEAMQNCTGYDADNILNQCKNALLKVKNGEVAYERDGVVFDEMQYSWALLAMLQRIAMENNEELCVLDFGGSLGSTYFQNKGFLKVLKNIRWCIVEQSHFVDCGKQYFEDEHLCFYYTEGGCLNENQPHVLILSGVLAYLENPTEWINKLIALDFAYIIVDRTGFIDNDQDILTIQVTHLPIYKASYPAWFFNLSRFKKLFSNKYTLISQFDNGITPAIELDGKKAFWNGLIFKKNE